jgi:ATP-dependent Clp protease protease subunit
MSNFWQFRNLNINEGELLLYGNIRSEKPWWDDSDNGIYPKLFASDLKALGNISQLNVRLNSGGGDVFAAIAIYTQLKSHPANVTVIIEGIAASAATIIMMAGDTVKAPAPAQVMIHDPMLGLMGYYNAADLDKMKDVLKTSKDSIINAYVSKTGRNRDELAQLMTKETWLTAEEAKAEGFVDEIMFEEVVDATMTNDKQFIVVNSILHDLSGFETRPQMGRQPVIKDVAVSPAPINKKKDGEETLKTIEELKNAYPDLYNQIVAAAALVATTTERDRLKAIDDISATIAEDLVAKAKYETPVTAENLAFQALKADAGKGLKFINQREEELGDSDKIKAEAIKNEAAITEAASVDAVANAANQNKNRGPRT